MENREDSRIFEKARIWIEINITVSRENHHTHKVDTGDGNTDFFKQEYKN